MKEAKLSRLGKEAFVLNNLYKLRIGDEDFYEFRKNYDLGKISLNSEAAVIWSHFRRLEGERSLDLVKFNVGEVVLKFNDKSETSLGTVIKQSKKRELKFCDSEVAFYVAVKMLKDNDISNSIHIPTKINGSLRVFLVERDSGNDIRVDLHDDGLVTKKSPFGKDEEFLFDK